MNVPKVFQTLQSFAQFLNNLVLSGVQMVDQETANARAQICIGCHNNVPSNDATGMGGCAACNKGVAIIGRTLKGKVLKDRITPYDSRLKACKLCGCFNQLQIWFPTTSLGMSEETINAYPTFCWKKQI